MGVGGTLIYRNCKLMNGGDTLPSDRFSQCTMSQCNFVLSKCFECTPLYLLFSLTQQIDDWIVCVRWCREGTTKSRLD